ncbi:3562_t:CDS:1, partial [Rhizophagus irregularis]
NNDQNNLDDILLAYISKKEAKLNAKAQSELKGRNIFNENINLGNKIKLSDEQVYNINSIKNLIKRQGKGKLA